MGLEENCAVHPAPNAPTAPLGSILSSNQKTEAEPCCCCALLQAYCDGVMGAAYAKQEPFDPATVLKESSRCVERPTAQATGRPAAPTPPRTAPRRIP